MSAGLVLGLSSPLHVISERPSPQPFVVPALTDTEVSELFRLMAVGRAREAAASLRRTLEARPRDCQAYEMAVIAASTEGSLPELLSQLGLELRDRHDDPFLLAGYARALDVAGEHARAMNLYARAVRDRSPCASTYARFVRSAQRIGRLEEAENLIEAFARAPALRLYGLGLVHEARGEALQALRAYEAAVMREATPADVYDRGARLLEQAGLLERALDWGRQGVPVAASEGPVVSLPQLLGRNASLLYQLGREREAEATLERARALAAVDPVLLVYLLLRHAYVASIRGHSERTEALVREAQRVPTDALPDRRAAELAYAFGKSYLSLSRPDLARAPLERSVALARRTGRDFVALDGRLALAQVDLMEGYAYRALESITGVLDDALRLQDVRRQNQALATAATIYERLGSFDRALRFYRLALRGAERDRDLNDRSLVLANIAIVEMRLGYGAPALVHAQEAARLASGVRDRRLRAGLLQSLGAALAGSGRLDEARRVYREALLDVDELSAPELHGVIAAGLGRVLLALGEVGEARGRFREALETPGSTSRLVELQAVSGLALAEWRAGELQDALELFERSLVLVESSRERILSEGERLRYLETRSNVYANLAGVLVELDMRAPGQGYAARAFEVVERSRARALLDVLAQPRRGRALVRDGSSWTQDARLLDQVGGELVLEYALGEERSSLWVISKDGLERVLLPPRRRIEQEVERFLKAVRTPPRTPDNPFEAHRQHAAALYRMLLEPVAARLANVRHIVIAPHGRLHDVPFEALGRPGSGGELEYFVEQHVVSYVPSLSVLGGLRRRPNPRRRGGMDFVGFAQSNPSLRLPTPVKELLPIPFADEEIETAARFFPAGRFRLYGSATATESLLKRELSRPNGILHIAAHALADGRRPERSAISIGAGNGDREDGVLSMREVLPLPVETDVVVLSGCETGLGRIMEIEGTLGFTWAFLSAGASDVAVTLWSINDRATATLMGRFYENVQEGVTPARALTEAKRWMLRATRKAYRHPYFWAPMILVGKGERAR